MAAGVLAATVPPALGAALYLAVAVLVLRLSIRWAREALGEGPVPAAAADPAAPKPSARG
jgi:hypothetical protein